MSLPESASPSIASPAVPPAPPRQRRARRQRSSKAMPARARLGTVDWVLMAIGAVIAAWVGWRVLTLGMADANVDDDPQQALAWRADDPDAMVDVSAQDFSSHDYDGSWRFAVAALRAYPLQGRAWSLLAQNADFFHRTDEALRYYTIAHRLAPRDLPTLLYLSNSDMRQGKLAAGFDRLDQVLLMYPDLLGRILPSLVMVAQSGPAQDQLGRLLRARPRWRVAFLSLLASSGPNSMGADPAAVDRIFGLRGANDPLPEYPPPVPGTPQPLDADVPTGFTEADLLINRQLADGRWQVARDTWLASLSKGQRAVVGLLFDGNFVFVPDYRAIPWLGLTTKGFGWQLPSGGSGYDASIGPRWRGADQNGLKVIFNGLPVDYQPVQQLLVLPPGHYRFAGMGQASGMTNDVGLRWTVACAQDNDQQFRQEQEIVITHSKPFMGEMPYGPFAFEFDIPAPGGTVSIDGTPTRVSSGCPAQWLRLDLGDGLYKGIPMQGGVVFDHLTVTAVGSQPPSPHL